MIGPPHGTKTSPRLAPSRKPPPRSLSGLRRLRRASGRSIQTPTCGKIRLAATRKSRADREVAQEVLRQVQLAQQPGGDQREDREARDEARDDHVRPAPAAARAARERIGSTGNTHGETAVTMPAAKAIGSRIRKRPSMRYRFSLWWTPGVTPRRSARFSAPACRQQASARSGTGSAAGLGPETGPSSCACGVCGGSGCPRLSAPADCRRARRDLLDRPEPLPRRVDQLVRARRVPLRRGEQRCPTSRDWVERGVDELGRVLLVAVAAGVGERPE